MQIIQVSSKVSAHRESKVSSEDGEVPKRTFSRSLAAFIVAAALIQVPRQITVIAAPSPAADPVPIVAAADPIGNRVVTGYTLGNPEETDSTPCIGAYGHDLCEMARSGKKICASNEFPAGTKIRVGPIECEVLDRMNKKFPRRVDIAFITRGEAVDFGLKRLPVEILNPQ